ncbi:MAG: energy-coupling factor ABC transporter ATP-binding protein [Ignisphaera sp.]
MIIELKDVWYKYEGSKKWALQGVSVSFREGETVFIIGHNGSGKTTLLKLASFILKPVHGKVYVDHQDFWDLDEEIKLRVRRNVVYVHEKPVILRGSVIYNVIYPLILRGYSEDQATEIAMKILEKLGIEDLAKMNAKKLSAGQLKLISIARAFAIKPKIIFLDEPFVHLDKERKMVLTEIIKEEICNGRGVVLTSHGDYLRYIDPIKIIVLENGKIIEGDNHNHQSEVLKVYSP